MGMEGIWLWNHITEEWEKAPAVVTPDRRIGTGLISGGAHKLYWISCTPAAPNAEWEITDAVAALGPVVLAHFDTDRESEVLNYSPPIPFTTGIYLETFVNMTSITFGYI